MEEMHAVREPDLETRPTNRSDLAFVLRTESAPENTRFLSQWRRERHAAALSDPLTEHWILELAGRSVGYAILVRGEPSGLTAGNVELKRLVITQKGEGLGREALRLAKRWAFEEQGAHRLWLDVVEHNELARGLYESEGFVTEGRLREVLRRDDAYESLVVMSMLASEYRQGGLPMDDPTAKDAAPTPAHGG